LFFKKEAISISSFLNLEGDAPIKTNKGKTTMAASVIARLAKNPVPKDGGDCEVVLAMLVN
jgi:hypothetical protein